MGSLKSLHTLFDKHLNHMLVTLGQNCMVQTIQNFELFDKKTKQNKTKQNKTKQNKTKQNKQTNTNKQTTQQTNNPNKQTNKQPPNNPLLRYSVSRV